MARWAAVLLCVCWGWAGPVASAAPLSDEALETIPEALRPWIPWVLQTVPEARCVRVGIARQCVWSGPLRLRVTERGASFEQELVAEEPTWLSLPGDASHFPRKAELDGRAVAIVERGSEPAVRVPSGRHRLRGSFSWSSPPELLGLPARLGWVELEVEGRSTPNPQRDADNRLRLRNQAIARTGQPQSLRLEVSRHVADGVPLAVTTRLILQVSGGVREARLPRPLLAGTEPHAIEGDLPAKLTPEGDLRVRLSPGEHWLEVLAHSSEALDRLASDQRPAPWPETEIWVFRAAPELREVDLLGPPRVDPSRTTLPAAWRTLPAFRLTPGAALELKTLRRGQPHAPPHRIELHRNLWLDLDGGAFTVEDRFSGTIESELRLDREEGELGSAQVDGSWVAFSQSPQSERLGVELRRTELDLVARSRQPRRVTWQAVGWSQDVSSLSARLHLPPGWDILAARGVDALHGTWIERWDLWGLFFVLVVSLAVARLATPAWGALAAGTLALTHHEADAPRYLWAALVLGWALLSVVGSGRLRTLVRVGWWVTWGAFAATAVPFAIAQLEASLFPVLKGRGEAEPHALLSASAPKARFDRPMAPPAPAKREAGPVGRGSSMGALGLAAPAEEESPSLAEVLGDSEGDASYGSTPTIPAPPEPAVEPDPDAVVQSGPALPVWQHRAWSLTWSGPVARDQRVHLYFLPPWLNRLLGATRVGLVLLLAAGIWRSAPRGPTPGAPAPGRTAPGAPGEPAPRPAAARGRAARRATSAVLGLLFGSLGGPGAARAAEPQAFPPPGLLEELGKRINQAPPCEPRCVSVPWAALAARGDQLRVELEAHAATWTSLPLPGPASAWQFDRLTVDGRQSAEVALLSDGHLHLRLAPGPHRVVVEGRLGSSSQSLSLSPLPRQLIPSVDGWELSGLSPDGRVQGPVVLHRTALSRTASPGPPSEARGEELGAASSPLPEWLSLERRLELGVRWKIVSTLRRKSQRTEPTVVRIPLLPGESVTEAAIGVERGAVAVSFEGHNRERRWVSTIEGGEGESGRVELIAARGEPWTETWSVHCSALWQCHPEGLVPLSRHRGGATVWQFAPWPAERLVVVAQRLKPAAGPARTIEHVRLTATPGSRLLEATVELTVRTTATEVQSVELPEGSSIRALEVDGAPRALGDTRGPISVSLQPGDHQLRVEWRQPGGLSGWQRVPQVELGATAHNIAMTLELPDDRWLLWTTGPAWGPAVLLWPRLLLVLALAWLLSRSPLSPLGATDWGLLGLGLFTLPAAGGVGVVAWLFLVRYRRDHRTERPWLHNGLQLACVVATGAALLLLVAAVYRGLVLRPDMQVEGADSSNTVLRWFVDRAENLPTPAALSAPLWVWRVAMLLWALWLASRLIGWLRETWRALSSGPWWMRGPKKAAPPAPTP